MADRHLADRDPANPDLAPQGVEPHPAAGPPDGPSGLRPLLLVRVLTVVNDNVLRWLAIGLGKKAVAGGQVALVLTIGTAGFVLPFVLLAWLAGWLADRYPKRSVIVWCKFAEILIATAAAAAVAWGVRSGGEWAGLPGGLWLLLAAVVVIGCQAALLAPSVIGTIPETVPTRHLSHANGIFAMVTLAATLVGMAGGNWLADATVVPEAAAQATAPAAWASPAAVTLVGLAIAGWCAALRLVPGAAAAPQAPAPWNALARTWADLRDLFARRELAVTAAGIVFFWALGAVAQLNVDQFATESGAQGQAQIVPLLLALVGGIGLGSLFAGRVSTRGVELGLVPLGAILMAVASFALAWTPPAIFPACGSAVGWGWSWAVGALLLLGLGAGIFDVPLEAAFQERSPPERRGGLLAASNLLTFAGMFAASMLYGLLRSSWGAPAAAAAPLLSARGIFAMFGLLAVAAAGVAIYAAPRGSLRMFVSAIVNAGWRFRIRGTENLPSRGPVVVIGNHLSWLDGFLLPLASPRPIRMVVYGPNIRGRFLRMLADQWRFILFDPRPKSIGSALKSIQHGLSAGDVIGIFCEGGISRTGQILGFKRGLEWLLERVESPLVPVSIDGLWGSLLSFSEGRYFTKWPRLWRRAVTVTFGPALPAGTHPNQARLALQELSAGAVALRLDPHAATAEAFDGCCVVRRDDRMVVSLGPGDPLHESLGTHAGRLLGIRARVVDAGPAAALVDALTASRATIWLARVDQVRAVAALPRGDLAGHLSAVVMPIAAAGQLPEARDAIEQFSRTHGIEPVVAFAPAEAGGLVAMNTPAKRITWDHEKINRPDTVGRVVNGVVVWPEAAARDALGLAPLVDQGIAAGDRRTIVIGATLSRPGGDVPRAVALATAFDIDPDGFLVVRDTP